MHFILSFKCLIFNARGLSVLLAAWAEITNKICRVLIIKPTRCTNFSNLFWKWDFVEQDQDAVPSWSCSSKAVYKPVWHIPLLSVQWITPDDGQRNCPKHVEFHFQNKFEKSVHLVGFIIRKFVTMHGHMNVKFVVADGTRLPICNTTVFLFSNKSPWRRSREWPKHVADLIK
jgi:hypothetical protein